MGKIFQAIDKQIIKPRVVASEREGFRKTKDDIILSISKDHLMFINVLEH